MVLRDDFFLRFGPKSVGDLGSGSSLIGGLGAIGYHIVFHEMAIPKKNEECIL